MSKNIEIKGARVNNLKNISLSIPRNKLIVIAGVSGSGKSSLAFDTLYAEGQRRYVESLSSYARQFLGRMNKPECDYIKGLPPAIAIEQKVISRNPRSTVGTSTEIYEYMRLFFARVGHTYSPISGNEVKRNTVEDVIEFVNKHSEGEAFTILSPIHIHNNRTLSQQLFAKSQQGYARIFVKGQFIRISEFLDSNLFNIEDYNINDIFIVIDRLKVSSEKDILSRLYDSIETAFFEGDGICLLHFNNNSEITWFSKKFEEDGIIFEQPSDNMFAFNSPAGACPTCEGFGSVIGIDEKLVIPNPSLSVYDGCVQCWHGDKMGEWKDEFCRRAKDDHFPIFTPYFELTQEQKDWLWHGLPSENKIYKKDSVCIDAFFQMVKDNQYKIQYRVMLSRFRGKTICPDCHGTRLKKETNWVKIADKCISDLVEMPINELVQWFASLKLSEHDEAIARRLLTEIVSRLHFLLDVGLGYLTLNRQSNTLSGGESQRINLTTSLGSSLVGSLYILDEPSIGLHSRDTQQLINVLKELKALGNTVVIVEHDEEIMRAADYIIDIGPDAGNFGGEIVFEGDTDSLYDSNDNLILKYPRSYTIKYLTHKETIDVPISRRKWNSFLELKSCRMNNLKGFDAKFPLNVFNVITGVSGSGKSTLIKGLLYPALKRHLGETSDAPGEYGGLAGDTKNIKHIEFVDQNPIGKSSRSNPATYVKAYDAIRQLFAEQHLSKQMGYTPQYFSFNTDGGRCEECKGAGTVTIEMQFMADLELVCDVCNGKRFKNEILEVQFSGKNISDILDLTVNEAIDFFEANNQKTIVERLKPLASVGLGYIKLGQSSSTLSGGENQRVKLAYYLGQEQHDPTLFIFDEPTTGLHFHDIKKLLDAFSALIERGHSVIVIEHNMDVIKCADHIIDLGVEGGKNGGNLVFEGTPEKLIECKESLTGMYLKSYL